MTEVIDAPELETEDAEDTDVVLRTTIVETTSGAVYQVRERFSTALKYSNEALKDGTLVKFSTGPKNRIAFDPHSIVIQEISR